MREPVAWGLLAGSISMAFLSVVCRPAAAKSTSVTCLPVGYWRVAESRVRHACGEVQTVEESTFIVRVSRGISPEPEWSFELARDTFWTPCSRGVVSEDQCQLELRCESSEEMASEAALQITLTGTGALSGAKTVQRRSHGGSCAMDFHLHGERVSPLQLDRRLWESGNSALEPTAAR